MTTHTISSLEQDLVNVSPSKEAPLTLSFFHNKKRVWLNLLEKEETEVKVGELDIEYTLKNPYLAHRVSIVGAEELKSSRF